MKEQLFGAVRAKVSLEAQISHSQTREGARVKHVFSLTWNPEDAVKAEKPCLTLECVKELVDIQYQWHTSCHTDRALKPDWGCLQTSKISSQAPIQVFYNDAGMNRLTVALDDCTTLIERYLGAVEENGLLSMRFVIPLDGTGETNSYTVTLWLDETDCRYEDAIRAVSKWWEEKYPPMRVPEAAKRPLYSFWYSFHQEVYEKEVEAECARAAELGLKTVIVDDGWQTEDNARGYAYCGDWQPAHAKIADMAAHVARVHDMGLKYVLWYSVPFVGKYSEAAKRFEGKTLEFIDRLGAYTLDPRYPEVRAYLIDLYERALREWDLDGFKLDFIDSFRMTENTPAFREGMDYVILEDAVRRLMVDVMKTLTAIKPDVLIEFRQGYIGPVMREFGNMFRVGDCPFTTSTNRIGMVDIRLLCGDTAAHSDMLVWHVNDRVENAVCQIENVLFSTVQISARLDRVPEEHVKAIRFWTEFMTREHELLVDTPICAECPQMLYPVVRAQKNGRAIIACYEKGYLVEVPEGLREVTLVSANAGRELLARFPESAQWKAVVRDCTGEIVREETLFLDGLVSLPVPECGLIQLTKE